MSQTAQRTPLDEAEQAASAFSALIADVSAQVAVAGSVRRRLSTVGDVELVAVPRTVEHVQRDLFDEPTSLLLVDLLAERLDALVDDGIIERRPRSDGRWVWGRYARALTYAGVGIDLYTPEAERAGWILLLRTGPAAFARQLVVPRPIPGRRPERTRDGRTGLLPPGVKPRDGWLTRGASAERIPTPTEQHVFDLFELPYLEPHERV